MACLAVGHARLDAITMADRLPACLVPDHPELGRGPGASGRTGADMALLTAPTPDALVIAMVEAGEHEAALPAPQVGIPEGVLIDVTVIAERGLHSAGARGFFDGMASR